MNYPQVVDYLNSFFNLEKVSRCNYFWELKLERMQDLLKAFGNPQNKFKAIHIAGSKGKGTVAVAIYTILKENGYRVGLYTSPHLLTVRERIRFSENKTYDPLGFGDTISEGELVELVKEVKPQLDEFSRDSCWGKPTFFEVYTLFAFLYFAKKRVDFAVLETGLGGRLDATNTSIPILTVITKILYEHTDKLGKTISEIAKEKAGIIKERIPVVLGPQKYGEAIEVIEKKAIEKKARVYRIGEDEKFSLQGDLFEVEIEGCKYQDLQTNLLGNFQKENLAIAVAAVHLLEVMGYKLQKEKVRNALSKIYWPGRFQMLGEKSPFILDCAHTPESVGLVIEEIKSVFPARDIIAVVAISSDKNKEKILKEIAKFCKEIVLFKINHIRLTSSQELGQILKDMGYSNFTIEHEIKNIFKRVNGDRNNIYLAIGSVFLIAEILRAYALNFKNA